MLYNNAARSNLGQGYWESRRVGGTHTRDTGGKDRKNLSLHTCCEFQPGSCSQSCGVKYSLKLKWDKSEAWLNFGANLLQICALHAAISACAISAPYKIPTFTRIAELLSPLKFQGRGLVQRLGNGVCFCSVTSGYILKCVLRATHWVFSPAFFARKLRNN